MDKVYDYDVDKLKRGDMIQVMKDLFGEENVCNISTFNTFSNKVAIRDIGRVLNDKEDSPYKGMITPELRDLVSKTIPVIKKVDKDGNEIEIDVSLKDVIKGNDELQKLYKQYPMWFEYALKLSGLPKSRGCHASAIMVTPKPVTEYCPVCYNKDGEIMHQAEMHALMDDIKLIKMDSLGLKNLSIADMTLKFAGITWEDVDINHLDLNDRKVYDEVYKTGETVGVFQMESAEARRMLIEAKTDNIEDIIVVNSANRPGTKDSFPDYCHNKLHPYDITVIHPDLKRLFKQSHCVLLYQEQALSLLRYAGFPEVEVETGRRAIGKKKENVMRTLRPKFEEGLRKRNWNDEQIEAIWNLLLKQSEYCFNRGHAVAYALLSYLTAYLKVHYPIEYLTACLIMDEGTDKASTLLSEAKRLGFELNNPDINNSGLSYTPNQRNNEILIGLGSIKGLTENGLKTILANRPFVSITDFMTTAITMNKGDVVALIKSGALDSLTNKGKMFLFQQYFIARFNAGKEDKKPIKKANKTNIKQLFDMGLITPEQQDDKELCTHIFNDHRMRLEWSKFKDKYCQGTELDWEMEVLNVHLSGNPFEGVYLPDWNKVNVEEEGWVGGVIINCKTNVIKNGKNKGKKMAFINLGVGNVTFDITVFANKYTQYIDLLKNGKCVVCRIKKDSEVKGCLQSIETLEDYLNRTKYVQEKYRKEN